MDFPNGRIVTVTGYRGRSRCKEYRMTMLQCETTPSGQVITAEFEYKNNFWRLDRFGRIWRPANGKRVTLCEEALVTSNIFPS